MQDQPRVAAVPARTFKPRRSRPDNQRTWSGHLPFANDLIAGLRPSILVELGTHYGESYYGMCQAVQENAVSCMCYAVDTWKGDDQSGFYDESVFEEVNTYNEENYSSFSKLLRMTFDEAVESFGDGTVDLLHIDGLHTYGAVRHDFDNWLPKVRRGGVVLLHDTAARHPGFEVWRLWQELAEEFSHLEFTHSWGLGVLRKPGGLASDSHFVEALFSLSSLDQGFLRHYYSLQAELLERQAVVRVSSGAATSRFQVYPCLEDGYSELTSVATPLKSGEWQHVVLELPQGSANGRIRVDPADRPCLIRLAGVVLKRGVDGSVLRAWTDANEMRAFSPIADLALLPGDDGIRFLSTGHDACFLLPELGSAPVDQPLVLDARVRIDLDLAPVGALVESAAISTNCAAERDTAVLQRDEALRRNQELDDELRKLRSERDAALMRSQQLSAEVRNLQAERVAVVADYRRVHAINESLVDEAASLKSGLVSEEERWRQQLEGLKAELSAAYRSQSWRLTAPLRRMKRAIR
jgi:Methyltransferase domain